MSEDRLQLWEAKGRAAFRTRPERPLGAALKDAGIDTRHPFYSAFLAGWEAELKAYEADLTPRGRTRFRQHQAEHRRKLRELVK